MLFRQHLGLGLAKAHGTAFSTALHPVHEVDPDADQQQEGQQRHDECLEPRLLLLFGAHRNVIGNQQVRHFGIFRLDGHEILGPAAEPHLFTIQRDIADRTILDRVHKLGIADFAALQRVSRSAEQVEQRQNQQKQNNPKGDITCISQGNSPNTDSRQASAYGVTLKIERMAAGSMR